MTPPSITVALPFAVIGETAVNLRNRDALAAYYDASWACFASFRKHNVDAELVFVTNVTPPQSFLSRLETVGAAVEYVPFLHLPPEDYFRSFRASHYLIDAIGALVRDHAVLFVDPDVVAVRPWRLREDVTAAYYVDYPIDYEVNGLSLRQMGDFGRSSSSEGQGRLPRYIGGEALQLSSADRAALVGEVESTWSLSMDCYRQEMPGYLRTEEHVLSVAFARRELRPLNSSIRRIWTARRYNNVDRSILSLDAWHLPAEKDGGLRKLAVSAATSDGWFWTLEGDHWRAAAAAEIGLNLEGPRRAMARGVAAAAALVDAARGIDRAPTSSFR